MKKSIVRLSLIALVAVMFGTLGTFLEGAGVITSPPYWALYGAVWGVIGTLIAIEP